MEQSESHAGFLRKLTRKKFVLIFGIAILTIGLAWALINSENISPRLSAAANPDAAPVQLAAFPLVVPTIQWGFAIDTFQVLERSIRSGESLSDLLMAQGLDAATRQEVIQQAHKVFDVRTLRKGNPYFILTKDSTATGSYLIYEPSVYEYIVLPLQGDLTAQRHEREVITKVQTAEGVVESSLWQTMVNNGYSYELTDKMEDALQWSVDFHHLHQGDEFRLVYEQNYINDEPVGVNMVKAAYYKSGGKEHYSFFYQHGKYKGYFNQDGRPMKAGFLKAPVKYSRISSYYNLNRLHPILKYRRPHYGTDYAAPYGTPIIAVGDGVVSQASFTKGNGNFVRLRHDGEYETQYLHMQRFAKGIRPGVRVEQGQTIGYVGSTGLATGPHVCFRFWKKGKQVNHLKLDLPAPRPLPDSEMEHFIPLRDEMMSLLKAQQQTLTRNDMEAEKVGQP